MLLALVSATTATFGTSSEMSRRTESLGLLLRREVASSRSKGSRRCQPPSSRSPKNYITSTAWVIGPRTKTGTAPFVRSQLKQTRATKWLLATDIMESLGIDGIGGTGRNHKKHKRRKKEEN